MKTFYISSISCGDSNVTESYIYRRNFVTKENLLKTLERNIEETKFKISASKDKKNLDKVRIIV